MLTCTIRGNVGLFIGVSALTLAASYTQQHDTDQDPRLLHFYPGVLWMSSKKYPPNINIRSSIKWHSSMHVSLRSRFLPLAASLPDSLPLSLSPQQGGNRWLL